MEPQGTEAVKLALKIGEFSYSYDLAFLASLALAIFVGLLFSLSKFAEPTVERSDDDFLSQLSPKYLATPEQYSKALILYTTTMSGLVVVLSLLGPRVISLGGTELP